MTGEKILNYKIENLSGENQLFRSFLATHTQFSKKVTVKTLKTLQTPEEKAELTQEIRRLSLIQHPNIITLYDYYESPSEFYLVFEYVPGKTLADYIENVSGPIPETKARDLFIKILDAFIWAHQRGVMNGAISANNIIITPDDNIKVLDLALSRFYCQKSQAFENKEVIAHLSPEQIEGRPSNQRADVYALGVLLFQMLTGKSPYQGFNVGEIKYKIKQENLPPTHTFYPMVSEEMQAVIQKATTKNPADRYQTCEDFKQALLDIKEFTLPKDVKEKQNAKAEEIQNQDKIEPVFFNLPFYVLLGLLGIAGIMLIFSLLPDSGADSEVLFNLQNSERIRQLQDSIAKAQEKKAIEDSMRVFHGKKTDSLETYYHRIVRGDNLEKIARRFYTPLDSLKKWNNLTGREKLKPKDGIKIKIRQIYKVQRNESLEQIATKFNLSPFVLKEVNQLYPKVPKVGELPEPVFFEGKDLIIPWIIPAKNK